MTAGTESIPVFKLNHCHATKHLQYIRVSENLFFIQICPLTSTSIDPDPPRTKSRFNIMGIIKHTLNDTAVIRLLFGEILLLSLNSTVVLLIFSLNKVVTYPITIWGMFTYFSVLNHYMQLLKVTIMVFDTLTAINGVTPLSWVKIYIYYQKRPNLC